MSVAIWWIRRDLRLQHNPALRAALQEADQVLPVFVLDPKLLASRYVGEKRKRFLFAGLRALHDDLRARGSYLLIRKGNPVEALTKLVAEADAIRVFAQENYSPYARVRDRRVERALPLTLTTGTVVHHPKLVLKDDGAPYTVYTPYSRRWRALDLPPLAQPAPQQISSPAGISGEPLPDFDDAPTFPAGEASAQKALHAFTAGEDPPIFRYADARNRVDLAGTSGLSPYLRFGMISPRQAVGAAIDALNRPPDKAATKGAEVWLNELIWREFYTAILYHFPRVLQHSFREKYHSLHWANNRDDFAAWCAGKTGYPLVDAAMRQLAQTGWMHNRARMVVASFLTKDLLIDWRWGEQWFMQHLVDGDPAANNGGWQWSAGTGTDAAPYFRIFNPISQSVRHDPNGNCIRKFVPELRHVPNEYIHEPWKMPVEVQQQVDCVIGETYPAPIVDHRWARERTLAAYRETKEESL